MDVNRVTPTARNARKQRRTISRFAACALTIGLGLSALGLPLGATAATLSDDGNDATVSATDAAGATSEFDGEPTAGELGESASEAPVVSATEPAVEAPVVSATEPAVEAPVVSATEPAVEAPVVSATEPADETHTGAVAAADAVPDAATITPRSVPAPPSGSAIISVKVGGDRNANGSVKGLAGVRLALHGPGTATTNYGSSNAAEAPVQGAAGTRYSSAWAWTTCVSDADGDCNFIVPIRSGSIGSSGVPQDTRFWVVQESSVTGWYDNPDLRVGQYGASLDIPWEYRFRTHTRLRAGETYLSTAAMGSSGTENPDLFFMRNRVSTNAEGWYAENVTRTTGVWNQSRANPTFSATCTLDVAIIADTSGSLGTTGMAELKSTMTAFVDAFRGTPTNMSLFSFSSVSPGNSATNHPQLLPVTRAAQANVFKAQYASWGFGGGTNWDAGFANAANASSNFDLAILLTDGNPTVMRNNPDPGSSAYNTLQDVDAGIFSANQLKAKGTRVIPVGVGPALTAASELNLRAVSGLDKGSDYFRASSFAEATDALTALAGANCQGSIEVQKMIVPAAGTIADAVPAADGWQFTATSLATNAVRVKAPATQVTTVDGEGKVDFGLTFPGTPNSGSVQIVETQQTGYSLVPVGQGASQRNAVCVNAETQLPVTVTNAGTTATPGFTVSGVKNQRIECKIYNREPAPGVITVEKSSNPASGTALAPGQNVSYTLTFRNTGGLPAAVNYEDVLTDVLDDAIFQPPIVAQSPLAAQLNALGNRLVISGSLAPGTTRTVTYTVRVKDTLPSGTNALLRNFVVPTGEEPPGSCEPGYPCTEHPVKVSLAWNKVDPTNTKLGGSEWLLTPYTAGGVLDTARAIVVTDCVATSAALCTGADQAPEVGQFLVRGLTPGRYQLTETKAPAGFMLLDQGLEIVVNTALSYGDIENEQIQIPGIPLTGGVGTLAFAGSAGGLAVIIAAALWWQRRRSASTKAPA